MPSTILWILKGRHSAGSEKGSVQICCQNDPWGTWGTWVFVRIEAQILQYMQKHSNWVLGPRSQVLALYRSDFGTICFFYIHNGRKNVALGNCSTVALTAWAALAAWREASVFAFRVCLGSRWPMQRWWSVRTQRIAIEGCAERAEHQQAPFRGL